MSNHDTDTTARTPDLPRGTTPAKRRGVFERLYTGTGAFDIVGKRKVWYIALGLLVLVCVGSMVFRGFHLGIEFEGGTKIQMPAQSATGPISTDRVTEVFGQALSKEPATVQTVGTGGTQSIQIKSETLNADEVTRLKKALFDDLKPVGANGVSTEQVISDSAVSGSWGGEISRQALIALAVFLVLVSVFLAFAFERWMAVSAIGTLLHDLTVTAGVYSLVGFEVTPSTVIGLLTILGFSLYDTVVVFDKVRENTRGLLGLTRRTYAEAANLALNQTLMRSINTSLIATLPVAGLLFVGAGLLGVGVLKDLALVLMVGLIAGAVSSIFFATPLLVDLKMTEPKYKQQAARVRARRENLARKAAGRAAGAGPVADATGAVAVEQSLADDDGLDAELRHERALAAASSVPVRNPKASDAKRARTPGRSGRPSGKKRR
ncbi:MAG TPA: protein translocase subunit SecF [Actinophytocola sp.]|uniref:protein translocase subunit SecF n=1 Tax=Actinophytocola sp. TaxID=1872138 RepID=UPI002DDD155B|nr:protein translocase subunit SecF [Actinophytocola sp.]HEV2781306.1 protein translocase subunit SecF [Actinophytocola sp.]